MGNPDTAKVLLNVVSTAMRSRTDLAKYFKAVRVFPTAAGAANLIHLFDGAEGNLHCASIIALCDIRINVSGVPWLLPQKQIGMKSQQDAQALVL